MHVLETASSSRSPNSSFGLLSGLGLLVTAGLG